MKIRKLVELEILKNAIFNERITHTHTHKHTQQITL